jgi:acetate kinase
VNALLKIWKESDTVVKLVIVAVFIVLVIFIYRLIKKALTKSPGQQSLSTASDELKTLINSGEKTNYSDAQFAAFADNLEQAMTKVINYLQNKADVLSLIKTFGIRDYTDDKFLMYNVKPFNLNQWFGVELNASDLENFVNQPLKQKGINYSF